MRQSLINLLQWNKYALLDFERKIMKAFNKLDEWKAEVFLDINITVVVALIILSLSRVFCSN